MDNIIPNVIHLYIFNSQRQFYLKRKLAPLGKWNIIEGDIKTSEDFEIAIRRLAKEKLCISNLGPVASIMEYEDESNREKRHIYVYGVIYDGEIIPSDQNDQGGFWSTSYIDNDIVKGKRDNYNSSFERSFRDEFEKLRNMIDFKSDLLRLAHKIFKENRDKKFTWYEDISKAYDKVLEKKYGEAWAWIWIKDGVFSKNKRENSKRQYNRKLIDAVNTIKFYLSANDTPIIEEYGLKSKHDSESGSNKKSNTDVSYKYPSGINYDFMDRWIEQQVKNYKGIQKKGLLRLLEKSEGYIPVSWLANDISSQTNSKQRKIVFFDTNLNLWGIELIPTFFRAIEKEKALEIVYKKGYMQEETIIFHPYFLKEYNHRWICFGKKNGYDGEYQVGLDRVIDIKDAKDVTYIKPDPDIAYCYFNDIVGLSHPKKDGNLIDVQHIEIEIHDYNAYMRIKSKPIHNTQIFKEEWNGDNKNGSARMSIDVRPNRELVGLLLSFGSQIHVLPTESGWLENEIYHNAKRIIGLYTQR